MNGKKLFGWQVLIVTIGVLLYVGGASVWAAQSPGCQALGGDTGTTAEFFAGERVRLTVEVFNAGPFTPTLFYDGVGQVTGTPLSPGETGRIAFTIPMTGIAEVNGVLVGAGNDADYSLLYECVVATADDSEPKADNALTIDLEAPDNRLNWRMGDDFAVMYPAQTANGSTRLDVYCYLDGRGELAFSVSADEVNRSGTGNAEAVLLASADGCGAELYLLPGGEIQVNILTPEAKLYEIICEDLQCIDPTMRFTDPNQ